MQIESVVRDRVATGVSVLFLAAAVFSLVLVVVQWHEGGWFYFLFVLVFVLNMLSWGTAIKARLTVDGRGMRRPGTSGFLIGWQDVADLDVVRPSGWWAAGHPYLVVHRDAGARTINLDSRALFSRFLTGIKGGSTRPLVVPVQADLVDAILAARPGSTR